MRKATGQKQRELIDNLLTARRMVLDAARKFRPDQYDELFLGTWSIKDLLAHLAGWDATNIQAVDEILSGKYPTFLQYYDKDWQSYNRKLIQEHIKPSLDELLDHAQASHRQLIVFLEALPAEAVVMGKARNEKGRTVSIANLLKAEAADELTHAAQITAYLRKAAEMA
jgi:uncharacterized damage-inducible protein DinB